MSRLYALTLLLLLLLFPWAASAGEPRSGADLLACARHNWVASSYHGLENLKIFRADFSKEFRMEVWSAQDNKQVMIRLLAPASEAGSGYLLKSDQLWYYSPAAGQAVPLPSASLSQAFLGSDLNLEDLYRGTLSEQYTVKLAGSRKDKSGRLIDHLVLTPKPEAPVVYGRLELDLLDSNCAVLLIDTYDQRDSLIRETSFSDFVQRGERVIPTRTISNDLLHRGNYSESTVDPSFQLDIAIPPERFSLACLADDSQCGSP